MSERLHRLRWIFLAAAVVLLVVFLFAQRQPGADVSYATSPSGTATVTEGDAGELTDTTLPSTEDLVAWLKTEKVVRLPGSIAHWDEKRVTDAIGDADIRILVTPPGLTKAQHEQLQKVDNATIRIIGTSVTGTVYGAVSDDLAGWSGEYATGDVTGLLLAIIAEEREQPSPPDVDLTTWRAPTADELAAVATDLAAGRPHIAPGATLTSVPKSAGAAFAGRAPLVAAFPQQPFGEAVPDYGPALAKRFPATPILVMYGNWISYDGPSADQFADVAAGAYYGRFADRLSNYAYPQYNVLNAYLDKVTDVRYAGLFDRPLPYQPFDPLRVALPALPWLFTACVLLFLVVSVRAALGSRTPRQVPGRLAGLTTLAIELSGLSHDAALTRAIADLDAARSALDEDLPDRHVQRLLTAAQRELDTAARELGRPEYQPHNYLAGGVA